MAEHGTEQNEKKIKRVLRMTIFVDKSFDPIFTMRFTPLEITVILSIFLMLLVAGVTLLIAFTGLREYIPGYPTGEERIMLMQNMQRADSIASELALRDNMFQNLLSVLRDELPDNAWRIDSNKVITKQSLAQLNNGKSFQERAFVNDIERSEKYDVDVSQTTVSMNSELEAIFFFPPIKGIITDGFDAQENHYGVDIVAKEGTPVMSTLDGTVLFSEWTVQTGYVIMIQHDNKILSVYKHNSILFKREGGRVRAGEAIAIIGNSGELTSGTHLHFEMWYQGTPLDPTNYINFVPDSKTIDK